MVVELVSLADTNRVISNAVKDAGFMGIIQVTDKTFNLVPALTTTTAATSTTSAELDSSTTAATTTEAEDGDDGDEEPPSSAMAGAALAAVLGLATLLLA